MTTVPPALRVRGLCKTLQQQPVLAGVDLDVAEGEVVAVTGANGSGKTTLLRCLAGRLRPDSGDVECRGLRISRPEAARWIGMVEHAPQLYPCLTARENLLFAARMHGLSHPAAVARRWLGWAGLAPWACWTVGQLSRGMRQRVAIARAVLHEPAVVLLDEPFTALDPAGREWVDHLVCRLATEGRSVCFTTHEVSDVRRLAGRVLLVAGGNVRDVSARAAVRAAA